MTYGEETLSNVVAVALKIMFFSVKNHIEKKIYLAMISSWPRKTLQSFHHCCQMAKVKVFQRIDTSLEYFSHVWIFFRLLFIIEFVHYFFPSRMIF